MADLKTTNIFGDAYINNKVGIATNAPATRLQIGQLSPTAATEGIQFGDDTSARLHRINTGHIRSTGGFSSATFVIADNYLQTNNNLIYPAGFSSTQRLEVGNAAQNAWIDGITIAPGGVVTVAGNISAANLSGTNTGDQTIGNGTITIAAGTGIGVGTTNTFTMNQSGNTTVTVTNSGVTSAVAGTGVSVSGATGAVTFSIGQAVGTGNSPTFTDLFTTGNIRLRNTDPTITFSDTNATSSFIHVNANTFFVLCGPPNSAFGEWAIAANGRWPLEINLTNNNATFGGNVDAISFSGAGTNLTGTAASLTAGTATSANALNAGNNYTVTSLTATSEIGTRGSNIGANLERGDSSIATLRFDADNFRFYAGGTGGGGELVRITEGGNVGIGSSSPGAKLEIGAGTSNVVVAKLTQGNERVRFNYFDLLGYNDGNLWMIGNNPTNTLVLGGGWDWDYQIGIAYTPGTIGVAGGILQIGQISKNNANYTHGNTRFYTNGIERLRITSNGNIGIGTTAPSASLQINSTTAGATLLRTDGTNGTLFSVVDDLSDSLMSVNNSAGLPILEVFADDRIVAGQYGQNDLVVKNNYVGIGTNNPAAKLYVTSSTSVPSAVFLGGNVGIGTAASSDAKLTILGETRIQSSAAYFTHLNYLDGGSNLISMANGGSTVFRGSSNNVTAMTVYGAGNVSINRDLIVNGGTSNPYGNRIIVGGTATTYTLQDATLRPTVYLNGNYPVLTLNNIETSNALHGPTLQFAFNGLTTGGTTSRQIVIGAPGTGAWLDFGFSGGAFGDNTSYNPHNGIGGYSGITAMRLFSNGLLVGSTGAYPNAITSISNALDVRGTGYFSSSLTASVFTGAGTGLTGTAANLTAGAVTNGVYTTGNQSIAGTKTFTGVTSFSNTSDYQIVLDGGGSTWAGINWSDVNGSDNIWFNGQNKTFAIGGGGANISGKKLHVDGGVTIGADYDSTTVLANGLNVQGPVQIGDYTILPINSLSAAGTQSRTYEIARIGIDYNDWNSIGTLEVELHEQYWSRGLKKVYNIWYGYLSNSGSRLVEWRGNGDNNFQCRIGSQVQISGDSYYLPVYVDVRNYGIVDVVVKTNRTITTNASPGIGYTYVNTAPIPTNISDFTADSDLEISTLGTAKLGGNTILTSASTIAGVNSAGNQNTSGNAATATSASYALSSTNATTAATANSVAWTNVSGRPTAVSAFTNDSGYLTSVTNISGNAGTATTANGLNSSNTYTVNNLTVSTATQLVGVRETYTTVNISTGVVTIDLNTGTVFRVNYNATISSFALNNVTAGKVSAFTLITIPAAGAGGITFSFTGTNASNPKWAGGSTPMATTTAGKYDVFSFIYDGNNWFGFTGGLNY
jgi:hypothetical protein